MRAFFEAWADEFSFIPNRQPMAGVIRQTVSGELQNTENKEVINRQIASDDLKSTEIQIRQILSDESFTNNERF